MFPRSRSRYRCKINEIKSFPIYAFFVCILSRRFVRFPQSLRVGTQIANRRPHSPRLITDALKLQTRYILPVYSIRLIRNSR